MDSGSYDTPQKKSFEPLSSLLPQKISLATKASPGRAARKILHPRSPIAKQMSSAGCSSYANVINTPPAKRFHKVKNPFEAALAECLHLPLIGSPSLFQCPTTPQFSSTQFEWTIEDVSSLKPAHVEPHETQFQDSPDPDYEAKAQMAISSYFKEQQIVPSPVDCPLRSQRIILSEMNGNTPISKPGRRIRECGTQTELTLPSVLPKSLEEALRPYLRMQLTESNENKLTPKDPKQSPDNYASHGSCDGFKDTSLRRKLFDMHNIVILDSEKRTSVRNDEIIRIHPSLITEKIQNTAIIGKLSDSTDKSSFGSLSPISAYDGFSISPHSPSDSKRKSRLRNFLDFSATEALSPIHPPHKNVICSRKLLEPSSDMEPKEKYRSTVNVSEHDFSELLTCGEKDHSDRSSSPFSLENSARCTDSSFNIKVSHLVVNTSNLRSTENVEITSRSEKSIYDMNVFMHEDTNDINYNEYEDLKMGGLSAQSSFCSSNSDTPRGKRRNRSASRKNLSQSFSTNCFEDYADEDQAVIEKKLPIVKSQASIPNSTETFSQEEDNILRANFDAKSVSAEQRIFKQRTDSGFNEMTVLTSSQDTQNEHRIIEPSKQIDADTNMGCCSTPSRHPVEIL